MNVNSAIRMISSFTTSPPRRAGEVRSLIHHISFSEQELEFLQKCLVCSFELTSARNLLLAWHLSHWQWLAWTWTLWFPQKPYHCTTSPTRRVECSCWLVLTCLKRRSSSTAVVLLIPSTLGLHPLHSQSGKKVKMVCSCLPLQDPVSSKCFSLLTTKWIQIWSKFCNKWLQSTENKLVSLLLLFWRVSKQQARRRTCANSKLWRICAAAAVQRVTFCNCRFCLWP